MKIIRTQGRGTKKAAAVIAALEDRGSAALDAVLPAVRRIVNDVRTRGDGALLRYAKRFDALPGPDALRVTGEEMAAAWNATDPALQAALTRHLSAITPDSACALVT